jgi:hypothetical protein
MSWHGSSKYYQNSQQKLSGGHSASDTTLPTRKLCWRWWTLRYRKTKFPSSPHQNVKSPSGSRQYQTSHQYHRQPLSRKHRPWALHQKFTQSHVNATSARISSAVAFPMAVASSTTGDASISPTVGGGNVTHCCGNLNQELLQLQPILRQIQQ